MDKKMRVRISRDERCPDYTVERVTDEQADDRVLQPVVEVSASVLRKWERVIKEYNDLMDEMEKLWDGSDE